MFEELFKNFINDGIMVKTDRYWVSLGGRGNDIYKVKRGYKGALKEVIKELGFKVSRDKDYKVDVILYKDMLIGCIE